MSSARRVQPEPVEIPEPTLRRNREVNWGEEFRQAYIQAKGYFESGVITNAAVAERVSRLVPTTPTSILRLGYLTGPPTRPNHRQIAYLALVAMGYDPSEFGLTSEDRALRGLTDIEIRKMLDPGHQH